MNIPAGTRKAAPPHPGLIIADEIEGRMSVRQLAAALGLSPNGLNKVILGHSPITTETALRLGTYYGNGPDLWLNLQRAYDLWHARKALASELKKIKPVKG